MRILLFLSTIAFISSFSSYAVICNNPYNEYVSLSEISDSMSEKATRECIAKKLDIRQNISEQVLRMHGVTEIERRVVDYCDHKGYLIKISLRNIDGNKQVIKAHFREPKNGNGFVEFTCD